MIEAGVYIVVQRPWWARTEPIIIICGNKPKNTVVYKYANEVRTSGEYKRDACDFKGDWLVPVSSLVKELF
jgi:hypothetical protein